MGEVSVPKINLFLVRPCSSPLFSGLLVDVVTHRPVHNASEVPILTGFERSPQGMIQITCKYIWGIHCPLKLTPPVLSGRIAYHHENSQSRLLSIDESYDCNQESLSTHQLYWTQSILFLLAEFQLRLPHAQCDN